MGHSKVWPRFPSRGRCRAIRWIVESRPFLFCRAEFIERIERGSDLLAFTGILVNLGKSVHQRDILGTNLLRQVVWGHTQRTDAPFPEGGWSWLGGYLSSVFWLW